MRPLQPSARPGQVEGDAAGIPVRAPLPSVHWPEAVLWSREQGQPDDPADDVPAALGFLVRHGVGRAVIEAAAGHAKTCGIGPETALFDQGGMTAAAYYRALAMELGVAFSAGGLIARAGAKCPDSVRAGVVPVTGYDGRRLFALAPRGVAITALLRERPSREHCVITTPSALQEAVLRHDAAGVAERAANRLSQVMPGLSYRGGPARWQLAAAVLTVAGWLVLLALARALAGTFAGAIFLGFIALRLGLCLQRPHPLAGDAQARGLTPDELPIYTVVLPLYDEPGMIERIVSSLAGLDYPKAKLDVKIVIEAQDQRTRAALATAALPPYVDVVIAPQGMPRTKPRALNLALELARGEFVTVYDAEDVPDPLQLRLAVASFRRAAPNVACLQAHLAIENGRDGWLQACFTLEYAALFDVLNPALAAQHLPVPLGGTSNHFRTAVVREMCGWDAWNVTEDVDLGLRLARMGYRVADLASTTFEEAPPSARIWLGQRTRWLKGWFQVLITHTRDPRATASELGFVDGCCATLMALGTVFSALGFPLFVALAVTDLVAGRLFRPETPLEAIADAVALTVLGAGALSVFIPVVLGMRRRGLGPLWPMVPMLLPYYVLVSCAAWCAVVELMRHPARWNKTPHGSARSSRSGMLKDSAGNRLPPRPEDA